MTQQTYDVVVIGGGAAGLSGALTLGRARRSVLVLDDATPRNAPAAHLYNYLTRDGQAPDDFFEAGRTEVRGYGVEIASGTVTGAKSIGGNRGFHVTTAAGDEVVGRRLLVATGLTDELPSLPGLAQRWGRDVVHCPYCHGWEIQDQPIGILATGPLGAYQAQLFRQWSENVTLLLNGTPTPTGIQAEELAARNIAIVAGTAESLVITGDRLTGVTLDDGRTVNLRALVVAARVTARSGFLADLGVTTTETDFGTVVAAGSDGMTAVPGVWAAGNVTDLRAQLITAAAAGVNVGAAINSDLIREEVEEALAHARSVAAAD